MQALVQLKTGPVITPEFQSARLAALMALAQVEQVTNDDEARIAADAQLKAQELIRAVERVRKELKRPLIDAGRAIEDAADEATADLNDELARIMPMAGSYAQELKEREREALRKAQSELDRIEREKQAALASATTEEEKKRAEEAAKHEAKLVPVPVSTMPEGQSARDDWDVTVTNIHELFRFHPGLCKIEPLLSEIKAFLDRGITVHGVTAKRIVKVSQRATKARTVDV